MTVRVLTLGHASAFVAGAEVDWFGSQRLRAAVLIHIAVERRVTRDALTSLLWPESADGNARHALRQKLYELRSELPADWLERRGHELRATPALACDAFDFERALSQNDHETAASLYAGPFLDGVYLVPEKSWETWVDAKRAQYARAFRRACREWVQSCNSRGDLSGACAAARAWVNPDPLDDEAQHILIQTLLASGERTDAIRQFETYTRLLQSEGLAPLDETIALIDKARAARSDRRKEPPANAPRLSSELPEVAASEARETVAVEPDDPRTGSKHRSRWLGLAAAAAVLVSVASFAVWQQPRNDEADATGTGQLTYVILPFAGDADARPPKGAVFLLHEAFSRWNGIQAVDPFQIPGALAPSDSTTTDPRRARALAERLGADRFVIAGFYRERLGIAIRAAVYSVDGPANLIAEANELLGDSVLSTGPYSRLAERLLFPGVEAIERSHDRIPGTASIPARRAFLRGREALNVWDVTTADSAMRQAVAFDPDYARAFFWLAQIRFIAGGSADEVTALTTRALRHVDRLPLQEERFARALADLIRGDFDRACPAYEALVRVEPFAFLPQFGLAECLAADRRVVRDGSSPSGWAFRTSYHRAVEAWTRAFNAQPAALDAFRADAFQRLRTRLFTATALLRPGRDPESGRSFHAYPATAGDTLMFIPWPAEEMGRSGPGLVPATHLKAIHRQRTIFLSLARAITREFPQRPEAYEAMAVALEQLGDESAIDTLRRARATLSNSAARFRLAAQEVWLNVKFGTPGQPARLRAAAALADTLLSDDQATRQPRIAATLAAITGRSLALLEFARATQPFAIALPTGIGQDAAGLLALAALGEPADSIAAIEDRLERRVRGTYTAAEVDSVRRVLLRRPAALASGVHTLKVLDETLDAGNYQLDLARAAARRDTTRVRSIIDQLRQARRDLPPATITPDGLVVEATALWSIGALDDAVQWIDRTLDAFATSAPHTLGDPVQAASFHRLIRMRADLARTLGRPDARRWQGAVEALSRKAA